MLVFWVFRWWFKASNWKIVNEGLDSFLQEHLQPISNFEIWEISKLVNEKYDLLKNAEIAIVYAMENYYFQ